MIESLGFDVFARDRASATNKAVGKSAMQAAADIEAANLRVERATRRLADATAKHGKDSLQARDASNKLTQAQLKLDSAQAKTAASTEKAGASMGRFRAVTVAATAIVGTALFQVGKTAVNTASDIAESQSKLTVVFGASAASVRALGETSADALGISKAAALDAAGTFGNLFVSLKLPQGEAAKMSVKLVQLAADLASFNNTSPEEALEALRSGLVGETEPLRKFGVNINDAALRQEALKLGLIATTKDVLPASVKAQASYSLILAQTTTAQGDFARTADGLANAQRRAKARTSDLGAELGGKLLPAVRSGTVSLLNLADAAQRNASTVVPAAVGLASLAASVVLVRKASGGLSAASASVSAFTQSLQNAQGAGAKFRTGVGGLTSMLGGPLNIALAAGAVGIGLLVKSQMEAKARVKELTETLDEQTGALTENTRAAVFKTLQDQGAIRAAKELGISLSDVTEAALGNVEAQERMNLAIDELTRSSTGASHAVGGGLTEAAGRLRNAVGGSNEEVRKSVEAFKDQKAAGVGAAHANAGLEASAKDVGKAMLNESSSADDLKKSLDDLTGKTISADEAAINYEAAVDDLTKSIHDNGHTLDIHTEKGRANRTAVINAAKAAMDHLVALRDQGVGLDVVTRKGERHRAELIRDAEKLGLNRTEARKLIDMYFRIPKSVSTTANLFTRNARQAAADLQARINALHGKNVSIGATAVFYGDGGVRRIDSRGNLGPIMKARGGGVDGPGTETSDSIPARLSKGEHVWTAREVRAAGGHGAMHAMRRAALGGSNRFAAGGAVGLVNVVDRSLDMFTHRLSEGLVRHLGLALGRGMARGWAQQWAILHRAFPSAQLFSSYRPGAITSSGNQSYHALGRAIDVTPSMAIFNWLVRNFGANAKEIIYSPAGSRQIKNGRPHYYTGQVRDDHFDHVHWAMDRGGVATGPGMFAKYTRAPERVLSPVQTRSFDRLVRVLDRGGARGGDTYVVHLDGVIAGGERQVVELVARGVKAGRKSGHLHRADFE